MADLRSLQGEPEGWRSCDQVRSVFGVHAISDEIGQNLGVGASAAQGFTVNKNEAGTTRCVWMLTTGG